MDFKMNPGWEDQLEADTKAAIIPRAQPVLDRLLPECSGMSTDAAKERLTEAWRGEFGDDLPEPHLSEWASALSQGTRVVFH